MSAAVSVFKLHECSKCLPAAATQNRRLRSFFRNDRIALSVNSCGKSFHIVTRQSSAWQCWSVLGCIASQYRIHMIMKLRYGDLNISGVIFTSESQFNYLFTLKNVDLCSNIYKVGTQPNIATKFAYCVAWILLCKHCQFGEKNLPFTTIPEISNISYGFTFWRAL